MPSSPKRFVIIGAGPCGLMAAEVLAAAGHAVAVYDRMPNPARKFLIAGRGGLNLTHSEPLDTFLKRYGAAEDWLAPSIRAYPPDALRAWCEGLGEETYIGSSGRVFPRSMKAVSLLRAWLQRLESYGVEYHPRHTWLGWQGNALRFADMHGQEVLAEADAVLLALGGASWPRLGSDAAWVEMFSAQGVEIAPFRPANGGFIVPWTPHFAGQSAGKPLKAIAVTHAGTRRLGEAMLTQQGIEGGVIYALSVGLRDAIEAHGEAILEMDLRPNMTVDALAAKLGGRGSKSLSTYLKKAGFSPEAIGLFYETTPNRELSPHALAARLKALPLRLTATTGLARAISAAGGITRASVDEGFMLRAKPGVFVAGEMLDWEAPTGGYLLQACFSTAVAAANAMLHYTAKKE